MSVDAIREIRVLTSTYAPEYGRSPGAQVLIVTRSGTNQFHGSAFEYLRNEIFDARNFFNVVPQPKPPLRQNDFGGTLGGPIHKNKAFFFFSYEGLRLRLPQTSTGTFFTAAARENVAPVFQPLLAALPVPNGPTNPDGITASLTASYSNPSNLNATSVRIDYNLTDRVTLFGRYNHAPSDFVDRYFSELEDFSVNTDTATVGLTILVSPTRLNEFRVNWSRQTGDDAYRMDNFYGAVPPAAVALYPPAYRLSDLFEFYSPDIDGQVGFGNFAANVQKQWNLVDTFSLTAVAHQLKFGLDFRRLNLTNGVSNWLTISSSYAQMQAGIAGSISQNAHASIPTRANDYSAFAQDIWKILPSLTLTYGLRWDVNTPPVSMAPAEPLYALSGIFDSKPFGLVPATSLWHTRLNNFAPRIGAAWQLTPKTVLRGGFGLFYDLGYGGGIAQTLNSFPYDRSSVLTNIPLDLNNPALTPPTISLTLNSSIAYLWAVDQHLRTPLTFEWNGTIEHALGSNQRLSASYLGAHGRNLLREDDIPQPPAGYPRVIATLNSDWSDYSALQVQFQRRMTRGLQALISYTFAKSTDTNSSDVCQCTFTNMLSNVNPAADLGPSDFDQRNAFAAAVSYQVPAPPGRPGHLLLGNWRADALVRSSSALPFGVWTFVSSPVIGYYLTRPNVVPGVPFYLPDANNPGGRVLNAAAFSAPGPGQYGNLPRNYFRGFPINQTDIALSRYFRVSERISLSARVEYFNVFNHPMFFYPDDFNNRLGLSSFGLVTQTLNNSLGSPLGGGLNPLYQVGGPRSAQFNLKLDF
ncbi:MAG: TonB-dependent receptor [Acidobacteriaceae bacterium]|nr:TonB-dependent receptor [Acidobacteriaceae bacterium]